MNYIVVGVFLLIVSVVIIFVVFKKESKELLFVYGLGGMFVMFLLLSGAERMDNEKLIKETYPGWEVLDINDDHPEFFTIKKSTEISHIEIRKYCQVLKEKRWTH